MLYVDLNLIVDLLVSPKIIASPGPVVRTFLGSRMSCTATGTPFVYTAILRNSTKLVNTTDTASIRVDEEGNYTCRATSNYGTDERQFVVINGEEIMPF